MIQDVDINCDLGEGISKDMALMPYISSCNIACGGHAGTLESMRETVLLAKKHRVRVGAHPAFPDRANFGRKSMQMPLDALTDTIANQIVTLQTICNEHAVALHHVKAHGALYNVMVKDNSIAQAFLKALEQTRVSNTIYAPWQSALAQEAQKKQGFQLVYEAFIDRGYKEDLSLLPRTAPGAVLHEPEAVWLQLKQMLFKKTVTTASGKEIPIYADTFCIHGDHENSVQIVKYIYTQLEHHSIKTKPYEAD